MPGSAGRCCRRKNTAPVHEWGGAGYSQLVTTWDRSGGAGGHPGLHRGHAARDYENTAGRVMLRAYGRGAGDRLQGLR
jgi:hypothetical protein